MEEYPEVVYCVDCPQHTQEWMRKYRLSPPEKGKTKARVLELVVMPAGSRFMMGYRLSIYPNSIVFNTADWTEIEKPQTIVNTTVGNTVAIPQDMEMEDYVIPDDY